MTKRLQQCFLFFIVVVIPGHNLGHYQVSVNRTIGPTLVLYKSSRLELFSPLELQGKFAKIWFGLENILRLLFFFIYQFLLIAPVPGHCLPSTC